MDLQDHLCVLLLPDHRLHHRVSHDSPVERVDDVQQRDEHCRGEPDLQQRHRGHGQFGAFTVQPQQHPSRRVAFGLHDLHRVQLRHLSRRGDQERKVVALKGSLSGDGGDDHPSRGNELPDLQYLQFDLPEFDRILLRLASGSPPGPAHGDHARRLYEPLRRWTARSRDRDIMGGADNGIPRDLLPYHLRGLVRPAAPIGLLQGE